MTDAVALGLGAAACWGVADFLGGIQTRRIPGVVVAAGSQAVALCLLAAAVVPFTGIDGDREGTLIALVAGVATAGGVAALYAALALGPMTVVAAITATGVTVPILFGLATGERPTALEGLGMALAGIGVLLAAQDRPLTEELRRASRRALVLSLLAAALLGIDLVALERSANEGNAVSTVFWNRLSSVVLLGVAVAVLQRGIVTRLRERPQITLAIGAGDVGGIGLFTLATTVGLLGIVALVSSLYPVITIALAYLLLGERVRPIQRLGVVTVLVGVGLLSLGA